MRAEFDAAGEDARQPVVPFFFIRQPFGCKLKIHSFAQLLYTESCPVSSYWAGLILV